MGRSKEKGKGREDNTVIATYSAAAAAGSTGNVLLADTPPARTIKTSRSTPFLSTRSRVKSGYESSPLSNNNPNNYNSNNSRHSTPPKPSDPSSSSSSSVPHTPVHNARAQSVAQTPQRRAADSVSYVLVPTFLWLSSDSLCSATLAQRLNELATANADGLLKCVTMTFQRITGADMIIRLQRRGVSHVAAKFI